jgi:Holliday junction resolvasome RuvABC endonuclease subunit
MLRPVIIALDPARRMGLAVGPAGGRPDLSSILLGGSKKADLADVCGHAISILDGLILKHQPSLIAVEEPFLKEGDTTYETTVILHGLYGAILGIARARNVTVKTAQVRSWRKVALGTSKFGGREAAKQAMMLHCKRLGWDAVDDNAADGGGLHIWASAVFYPFGVADMIYARRPR